MMTAQQAPHMDLRQFEAFRELAQRETGICIGEGKQAMVWARIARRVSALKLAGPEDYLALLSSVAGRSEVQRFVDAITTNLTWFFRERDHFTALENYVRNTSIQRPLRLWSAACSTGEEPYSMAMVLADLGLPGLLDAKVLATDISSEVLAQGQSGVFQATALRETSGVRRRRHFRAAGSSWVISPMLRSMVIFRQVNLIQPRIPVRGPFDVIFLRNVLIYFGEADRRRLVGGLARLLLPGGLLVVGHSESVAAEQFGLARVQSAVYRKRSQT